MRVVGGPGSGCRLIPNPSRRHALRRVFVTLSAGLAGCRRGQGRADTARLSWSFSPDPPRVGPAILVLSLVDARAQPVEGVRWRVEGDMTHPGMRPIMANVTPGAGGGYEAHLEFTMAGDWVLLVRADWAGGQHLDRSISLRVTP